MEKLKSILESLKKIPKENKRAYLLAAGVGFMASLMPIVLSCLITFIKYDIDQINQYSIFLLFDNLFPYVCSMYSSKHFIILLYSNLLPISTLIFLFILLKKIPIVWKNIRTRIISIVILSISYVYCFFFIGGLNDFAWGNIFLAFPGLIIGFFYSIAMLFLDPLQSFPLTVFVYSNIFVVTAGYLATKRITNLPKRITSFFFIELLICIAAAASLVPMCMFY
jgi:hypothetical protein